MSWWTLQLKGIPKSRCRLTTTTSWIRFKPNSLDYTLFRLKISTAVLSTQYVIWSAFLHETKQLLQVLGNQNHHSLAPTTKTEQKPVPFQVNSIHLLPFWEAAGRILPPFIPYRPSRVAWSRLCCDPACSHQEVTGWLTACSPPESWLRTAVLLKQRAGVSHRW